MRLVLLGPPGAGKGTQAGAVSQRLGIPAISTGDIFRAHVNDGTSMGQEVQRYLDAGEYVPDTVTNDMVRDRLAQADCEGGFLLDGYPRTVDQLAELDGMLSAQGHALDVVVELVADADEVVRRLTARSASSGRADDDEGVIRRRLQVFADQTAPLAKVYADRGLLRQVDGIGPVDEVTARVLAAIADR